MGGCKTFDGELICKEHQKWGKLIHKTSDGELGRFLTYFVARVVGGRKVPGAAHASLKVVYAFSGKTAWLPENTVAKYLRDEFRLTENLTTAVVAYESGALPKPDGLRTLRRLKKMLHRQARQKSEAKKKAKDKNKRTKPQSTAMTSSKRSCSQSKNAGSKARAPKRTCQTERAKKFTKLGKTSGVAV